jgi:hypothetical protein
MEEPRASATDSAMVAALSDREMHVVAPRYREEVDWRIGAPLRIFIASRALVLGCVLVPSSS